MLPKSEVKYIQSLGHKKFREAAEAFPVEGPRMVRELLHTCPERLLKLYAMEEWLSDNGGLLAAAPPQSCMPVSERELSAISSLQTPQSVVALCRKSEEGAPTSLRGAVTLVLDGIQDPGNFGTIIRTADWFGVRHILCSPDTADLYNPKVLQATMGSVFRVGIHYLDLAGRLSMADAPAIFCATLEGGNVLEMNPLAEGLVVVGNEGRGISTGILALSSGRVTIPRRGLAESLNAAVATGIILSRLCGG